MSEIIPLRPVERIWKLLTDREYRRGFAAAHVGGTLAAQIYTLRTRGGLSQKALANKIGSTQPQISAWESNCENVSVNSLIKIAEAFDVGLIVKFAPFSTVVREATTSSLGRNIPSFELDSPLGAASVRWSGGIVAANSVGHMHTTSSNSKSRQMVVPLGDKPRESLRA